MLVDREGLARLWHPYQLWRSHANKEYSEVKGTAWMDRIQTEWWWMFKWRIPEMSGILFPGSRWREQRASSGHEQLPRSAWLDRGGHQCPVMMMDSMHEEVIAQRLDGTVQLV